MPLAFTDDQGNIRPLTPLTKVRDIHDETSRFFEALGYEVDWDLDSRTEESWYEVLKDGALVAQIDMGAPLADIIEDLSAWHEGKPSPERPGSVDYLVNMGDGPDERELLAKVHASRAAGTASPEGTSK